MWGLIRLLKPLAHVMALCIFLGTAGFFCAIAVTVLAANLLLTSLDLSPWGLTFAAGAAVMIVCAVARAALRYGEQLCGHFIAFKLLAILRDKVFGALRRLAPAKLEGRNRGDLISLITSDIELLEVFYAHTIAPVCIAVLVSAVMTLAIGSFHPVLGLTALAAYLIVGCVIPLASSRLGRSQGMEVRNQLGEMNSFFLESLRGIRETLQYGQDEKRAREISEKTDEINALQGQLKKHEGSASSWSGASVMALTIVMLGMGLLLDVSFPALLLSTVMLSASFGPVLALANLSAAMDQTLASGERVLSLLEETPETEDVIQGKTPDFTGAAVKNLTFSYEAEAEAAASVAVQGADSGAVRHHDRGAGKSTISEFDWNSDSGAVPNDDHGTARGGREEILHDLSADFPKGEIIAVIGRSGSGKSTLLKLLMRFWKAPEGSVLVSDTDVGSITTDHLRTLEGYMTQETDLFHDSIGDNIRIGKLDATQEEVEAAAKKASLHDFILTLPQGYDTPVGELGETLSGGERQRIGLARAFLHDAPFLLLDEPTSNLDSLNEGVVLKALRQSGGERTVILVTHRKSTLAIADRSYSIESGRMC